MPAIKITSEITVANMGLSIKNFENINPPKSEDEMVRR